MGGARLMWMGIPELRAEAAEIPEIPVGSCAYPVLLTVLLPEGTGPRTVLEVPSAHRHSSRSSELAMAHFSSGLRDLESVSRRACHAEVMICSLGRARASRTACSSRSAAGIVRPVPRTSSTVS